MNKLTNISKVFFSYSKWNWTYTLTAVVEVKESVTKEKFFKIHNAIKNWILISDLKTFCNRMPARVNAASGVGTLMYQNDRTIIQDMMMSHFEIG